MNRASSLLDLRPTDLRPMTPAESEVMVMTLLSGRDEAVPMSDECPLASERGWNAIGVANVNLRPRLEAAGVTISEPVFIIVCSWVGTRPADVTLWAYALVELARKNFKRHLTSDDLVHAFPFGIPTEAGMRQTWDAQKYFGGAIDNWLDTDAPWTLEGAVA